ncbi:MAG: hypothetical protein QS721_01615 [Candidatus Endonucleobacter sp. (ex Gigantidas childressi)]|nr:hypothetical protein [Candidatus Endonucleobacter sp. (ex Gigantidas childressi)]
MSERSQQRSRLKGDGYKAVNFFSPQSLLLTESWSFACLSPSALEW